MIRVDVEQHPKLTEGLVQLAIADYVQWWRVLCVPNLCLWHEMDMAVLTKAGCLWEFEIKLSQADWERDQEKDVVPPTPDWLKDVPDDWQGWRPRARRNLTHVERFYYVHAAGLVCPAWVPEWCGLIAADFATLDGRMYVNLREKRRAVPRKATKPTEKHVRAMYEATYHRFWRHVRAVPVTDAVPMLEDGAA